MKDEMKQPQVGAQSSVGENVQQASIGRGRGRSGKGGGLSSGLIGQSQPQARVYAITRQEAPSAPDIITGTFSICGFDARVLIDPRSIFHLYHMNSHCTCMLI